jgi:hypothetical protein
MITRTIILLAAAVALLTTSCGKIGGDPIVGKWRDPGGRGSSEYFADGTAALTEGSMTVSAKWKRLDDDRVMIETTVLGIAGAQIYKVKIGGDSITFTDDKGKVQTWTRGR